jgi:hypothetical protein
LEFNVKLNSELDTKYLLKEYGAHFARWLPGEIEKRKKVNVPVPVRKFYRILKWIHQKIHIKIKIDRSVLVSLEKGKIMPHANEIEEAVLGAL